MAVFLVRDPKCVFIHIPKTGGASIRHGVFQGQVKGPKQGFVPENWMQHFKFAFVRNPYDRAVSAWQMFANGMQNSVWQHPQDQKGVSFKRFLELAMDDSVAFDGARLTTEEKIRHHAIPQTHKFNCLQFADFVGRFESFEEDFKKIAARIGHPVEKLPHWNRTQREANFMSYYDAEAKSIVEDFYREDFAQLNYPIVH